VPPVYRELARREPGPVLELPVGVGIKEVTTALQSTWYEYFSIFHWRPLLNGYASYWPPSLEVVLAMARALPAPRALANLVDCTGVRWIVAHTDRMPPPERAPFLTTTPGLRLVERFGADLLFEVEHARPAGACASSLRSRTAGATVEGTPLAELPASARRAVLESVEPAELVIPRPPAAVPVRVRIRNVGSETWPAVALDDTYLVRMTYVWSDASGRPLPIPWRLWTRLPVDVHPGQQIEIPVALRLPGPGSYRLEIVVRQGLQGLFDVSGPAAGARPVVVR
jgi:hypothetical protein